VDMNDDGVTNSCNWNATDTKYKGVDVAQAMLRIAQSEAFISGGDDYLLKGLKDGSVIAAINGTWNSVAVEEAFGENYAAAKLPEYTINGDKVQMCSFAGYKLLGVNAYTKHPEWAMKLARYLTDSENQLIRFRTSGETPANAEVAASEEVQKSPAVAALAQQSKYGYLQRVADGFWTPTSVFGTIIISGNPDGTDLQELLDDMNNGITAEVKENN
ncbi:MAG: extracellular solute-binding protein, partial [Firmicutes bacterium]|nr:extracellular solute-binding protein [Bacillota bacterium]